MERSKEIDELLNDLYDYEWYSGYQVMAKKVIDYIEKLENTITSLKPQLLSDGTLVINTSDFSKVKRVLISNIKQEGKIPFCNMFYLDAGCDDCPKQDNN